MAGSRTIPARGWARLGDNIIALVSISYEGREDNRPAHVWTLSDGQVTRLRIFPLRARAFEALGRESGE
jgi:hypothetical protein